MLLPIKAKNIRRLVHRLANQKPELKDRMMAAALDGPRVVRGSSYAVNSAASASNPFARYLDELAPELPWQGLTPSALPTGGSRAFETCAEAKVWLELRARGHNPKHFTLVTFNSANTITSPCQNCARWVRDGFGRVYQETPTYRERQRPDR